MEVAIGILSRTAMQRRNAGTTESGLPRIGWVESFGRHSHGFQRVECEPVVRGSIKFCPDS